MASIEDPLSVALRVLILSWEYPPVIEGGLARHVRKLSEALVGQGAEVHVLTRAGRSTAPRELRHGVHVHRVATSAVPADSDRLLDWVANMNAGLFERGEALRDLRFDVVHGHDWLVADAAARLARVTGAPFVATIHATEHGRHQGWVSAPPQSQIHATERWMAHAADRLIVCSHYMREHVAEVFAVSPGSVAVIPNGIDADDLQPIDDLGRLRDRFAAPGERLVLLVGRLVYEKGFQDALAALGGPDGVIERVGTLRFVIAGSGIHEAELRRQAAALGLDDHGAFLGWVGDDMLHSLYRIADLTVVPSIYEPFGLVALEAMASGCPCVVADTGGLREIVPDLAGVRFESGDRLSLARAIEEVLTDTALRRRLVADAARHVRGFDSMSLPRRRLSTGSDRPEENKLHKSDRQWLEYRGMARSPATDVHQHLWPEEFVSQLSRRRSHPYVRRAGRGFTLRLPAEPDHRFTSAVHDPRTRGATMSAAGIDRALVAMSSPLGIEALAEDEARPLLQAWHDGVFALGAENPRFAVWGAIALGSALPEDADELLDRGAVGISVPAEAIATPQGLEKLGPVLRRLEIRGAPLFVHPGAAKAPSHGADWWPAMTSYVAEMQTAWFAFAGWGRREHPTLRVCFAMLAGGAPLQVERLAARGGPARAVNDPRLYYDTSSYGPKAIAVAASIVGVDQLVHGSDQPVVDGRPSTTLGRNAAAAMARENVARLITGVPGT